MNKDIEKWNTNDLELKCSVACDLIEEIIKYNVWTTIPKWDSKRYRMENPERMTDVEFWSLVAGVTKILYDFRDNHELWNSEVIGGRE